MKRLLMILAGVGLLVGSTISVNAQAEEPCSIGGQMNELGSSCTLSGNIDIDINYPQWINNYDFARKSVNDFLVDVYDGFWSSGIPPLDDSIPIDRIVEVTYEEFTFRSNIKSIVFQVYHLNDYRGAQQWFQSYVFDLAHHKQLTLMDLFQPESDPLAIIAPIVQLDLEEQLGKDADLYLFVDGIAPTFENYDSFALTDDALMFFFAPREVAPPTFGSFQASVPLEALSEILLPEFQGAE